MEEKGVDPDWDVVELLNDHGRTSRFSQEQERGYPERLYARDAERFMRELASASGSEGSDAPEDRLATWDDGGEYARAAEAAGVDIGGMLDAGVDAKKLLDFVSNYRRAEGDQLRLLDKQNLKFATSKVLRKGEGKLAEATSIPTGGNHSSNRGSPTARQGAGSRAFNTGRVEGGQTHNRTFRQHERPEEQGQNPRFSVPRVDPAAHRVFGEDDGAETARLCGELLRWSSALEGAGGQRQWERKSTEICASTVDDAQEEAQPSHGVERGQEPPVGKENNARRVDPAPGDKLDEVAVQWIDRDRDRGPRQPIAELSNAFGCQDRSTQNVVDSPDQWDWAEGGQALVSAPGLYGGRVRSQGVGDGHSRPTPSYALPTKHFKTLGRDRGNALAAEEAHRRKKLQRQAQLDEENTALKLRLEGQRRAIHELEHQAQTLRETNRQREDSIVRLKRKLATTPATLARGTCSCCASTHHARPRSRGDAGAAALKKRALDAEVRVRELERTVTDSRAKEQRAREIGASLKCNYSVAHEKAAGLEVELASVRQSLLEARRDTADTRKEAKTYLKNTRKYRQQQDERTREAEIARVEAADLALQLKKVIKELEAARAEVVALRRERTQAEARASDLARENSMLQDRMREEQIRSKMRERDRWIVSELRTESQSPSRVVPDSSLPKAHPTRGQHQRPGHLAPSAGDSTRNNDDAAIITQRTGRRRRLGEAALDSPSASESPEREGRLSYPPDKISVTKGGGSWGQANDMGDGLPPRGSSRAHHEYGTRRRWADSAFDGGRLEGGLSTRSADGADGGGREGAPLDSSTVSAGSNRSTMGARYERLQAMYRRVNRRDAGTRGRAGVG